MLKALKLWHRKTVLFSCTSLGSDLWVHSKTSFKNFQNAPAYCAYELVTPTGIILRNDNISLIDQFNRGVIRPTGRHVNPR